MPSGGQNTQPIAPVSIVVPTETGTMADPSASGALILSGNKLHVGGVNGWELVTSG